jgi:virginiamycin B lyase
VGFFDPATEEFRELRPPTPNSRPHGIAVSPGDVIWFTEEAGNKIARVDPQTLQITEYPLKNPNSGPHTPIYDGRGAIWFTEQSGNRIGRLNIQSGEIEEFEIPTPNSGPYGIVADAAGNAWFCAFGPGSNRIGRVDAATGRITEYRTPTPNSGPRRPWIDSKGRIWFVENRANRLAVFDPGTEQFKEWDSPSRGGEPYGIVVDGNDIIWYNEFGANTMVRFDPATERFTVFPFPTPRELVRIVAVDPSNRIWYGNNGNSKLGVMEPLNSVVSAASFQATEANPGIAPGAIVSIFGANLAASAQSASGVPLPTTLLDASVTLGGVAAPLFFVSPRQINAQAPFDTPAGAAWVHVRRGVATVSQAVTIASAAPGIFTVNQQGSGPGIIAHADDFRLVSDAAPVRPGELVSIFCTGLGPLRQNPPAGSAPAGPEETLSRPQVTIADLPATVVYSGAAPGFVGLYQVNVQVPPSVSAGAHPLQIIMNGVPSNTVTIAIR